MSKRSKADIWMPLYIGDWDDHTRHLDCEQDGAYGRLVRNYWKNGPPVDDDAQLARIVGMERARWRKSRPVLAPFFEIREGRWFHKRVEQELARARDLVEKRAQSGSKGAEGRWAGRQVEGSRSERLAAARKLGTHTKEEWHALVLVLGSRCVRCGVPASDLSGGGLCKDHIVPLYQGGSDGLENLQPLCRECNAAKGADVTDRRPEGWEERLAKRLANAWQTPAPARVTVDVSRSEITSHLSKPIQELDTDSQVSSTAEVVPLAGRANR